MHVSSVRRVALVLALGVLSSVLVPTAALATDTTPGTSQDFATWARELRNKRLNAPGSALSSGASRLSGSSLTSTRIAGAARNAANAASGAGSVTIPQVTEAAAGTSKLGMVGKAGGAAVTAVMGFDLGYTLGGSAMQGIFGIQSDGFWCDVQHLDGTDDCALAADPEYVANSDFVVGAPGFFPESAFLSPQVTTTPVWQFGYSMATVPFPATDPYGAASYPAMTFSWTWNTVLMGIGTASSSFRVHPVCRVTSTGALSPVTSSGRWAQGGTGLAKNDTTTGQVVLSGSLSATVAAGSCVAGSTFYGWALSDASGSAATEATITASIQASRGSWFLTPANPGYSALVTDPTRWWKTTWKCEANGASTTHSAEGEAWNETDEQWPAWPTPDCDGGALTYVKAEEMSADADPYLAYEWEVSPEVAGWQQAYPECADGSCLLDLQRVDTETGTQLSCFDQPDLCTNWFEDPMKVDTYRCVYGTHVIDLAECNAYRPTFNYEKAAAGSTFADPVTGEELPTGTGTGTDGRPADCPPPFKWNSLVNPWWYYKGVQCALYDAFVPTETSGHFDVLGTKWAASDPGLFTNGVLHAFDGVHVVETGCKGPGTRLPASLGSVDFYPLDACTGWQAVWAPRVKVILGWFVGIAMSLSIIGSLGRGLGYDPGMPSDVAESEKK